MSEFNNQTQLKIPKELMKPRFVPKSGLSKEEAKKICEENGVVWVVE
jgi:hypothetical protein